MPDRLTRTDFEPHRHTSFTLRTGDNESLALELIEVQDKTPIGYKGEQFSLLFLGPPDRLFPQQIYPLRHAAMGDLDLFLVPIARRKEGYVYEAFFNLTPSETV